MPVPIPANAREHYTRAASLLGKVETTAQGVPSPNSLPIAAVAIGHGLLAIAGALLDAAFVGDEGQPRYGLIGDGTREQQGYGA